MKNFKRRLAFFFCAAALCSCRSLHEPKEIYVPLDYTEDDARKNEIERITEMAKTNCAKALWRAVLLDDKSAIDFCAQKTVEAFNAAVDDKNYFDALTLARSLSACGFDPNARDGIDRDALEKMFTQKVPGLAPVPEEFLPKTINDCINATVTVWVDRGITIKSGAAFADRVIGSGFFISRDGYLITNHHVIADIVDPKNEKFMKAYVKLPVDMDTRIPAKIIGWDSILDLALLKVEIDAPFVFELGSSADLSIGDKISAIGTPLGLDGTLTSGIVSAVNRKLFTTGSVLQIDAAVNSGNSGGPLIDSQMRVQAVVFAGMLQYQGLNFAIPVEYLRQDLPILYRGGNREHPWTGSYGRTKKSEDGKTAQGLETQYVMPGGSACRAGIKEDDVITALDGKAVASIENMQDILRGYVAGTVARCEWTRGDEKMEKQIYLETRPESPGFDVYKSDLITGSMVPLLGMKLVRSSTTSRRVFSVTRVISGSVADESGFSENDPVAVNDVKFAPDKSAAFIELYTRRSKKGYLDLQMGIPVPLDSPYYF